MALTLQEIQDLRSQGKYHESIAAVDEWIEEHPKESGNPAERSPFFLEKAWAHYQLGEYDRAEKWGKAIADFVSLTTDMGASAWRLLAHCAERRGDLDRAENLLRGGIPPSADRDNLYVTILVGKNRKGIPVVPIAVMKLVTAAQMRAPYQVVDGHIVNNAAWLLHEARAQEDVKPFVPILPGLIEVAIGIYEATWAPGNHRAAALFRASYIFEVADWTEAAVMVIGESIALWKALVASQGGERYRQNLENAEKRAVELAS